MQTSATPPSTATTLPWWRRIAAGTRLHWIFAALIGLIWATDTLMLSVKSPQTSLLAFPGMTLMCALALLGRRHPVHSGLAGAVVMLLSSLVIHEATGAELELYSAGIQTILPTENAAGMLLVLYVCWLRPLRRSVPVTAALVLACLISVAVRIGSLPDNPIALGSGFLQLLLAAGTGLYLRGGSPQTVTSPLRQLLGRQWPMLAALLVIMFSECITLTDSRQLRLLLMAALCGVVMSGLAVFAPIRPVEAALLGALSLVLTVLVMRVLHIPGESNLVGRVPITSLAAGMLLVAFATRYSAPPKAAGTVGALVFSALFALFFIPEGSQDSVHYVGLVSSILIGGFLLVLSVGAGMYFRSRDGERNRTVRSAVSHAQQAERLALARELHDVVAHHVTGIVVQAQAAQTVAEQNPTAAKNAMDQIATSGAEALSAMRRLVGTMRGAEPAGASVATEHASTNLAADLEDLVDRKRTEQAGAFDIQLSIDAQHEIPQEVARSTLRLVQESLTNSENHALDATRIQITIDTTEQRVRIQVTDDGTGARTQPPGGSGGYGLIGMRERVELLGGHFSAGPSKHTGWRVEAWLPLDDQNHG